MTWTYSSLPESLRMPPCPVCSNRLAVRVIIATLYVCLDCPGPHLFRATWRAAGAAEQAPDITHADTEAARHA